MTHSQTTITIFREIIIIVIIIQISVTLRSGANNAVVME